MRKPIDITNKRYGRLIVLRQVGRKPTGRNEIMWECRCDCGNLISIPKSYLSSGDTKSCGCYALENKKSMHLKHGLSGSYLYNIWSGMKQRCNDKSSLAYPNYGGRGIKVCNRWMNDFSLFAKDMGDRPSPKHTLERINNNKGYYKSNCKWATVKEQSLNRRSNISIQYKSVTYTALEFSEKIGITLNSLYQRLQKGWSISEIASVKNVTNQYRKQLANHKINNKQ